MFNFKDKNMVMVKDIFINKDMDIVKNKDKDLLKVKVKNMVNDIVKVKNIIKNKIMVNFKVSQGHVEYKSWGQGMVKEMVKAMVKDKFMDMINDKNLEMMNNMVKDKNMFRGIGNNTFWQLVSAMAKFGGDPTATRGESPQRGNYIFM